MLALLAALAASIDIGRLYFAQRDLQRYADLAALDGARTIGGCRGVVASPLAAATTAVTSSLVSNGGTAALLAATSPVEIGTVSTAGGIRQFVASAPDDAIAVRVNLSRTTPSRLIPFFGTGGGTLKATAAAFSTPIASISVGTSLASINSSNSALLNTVLGGLLGASINLDAVSYKGLASTNVTLAGIAASVGAGTVGDFLNTTISAPAFLTGIGNALSGTDAAAAAIFKTLGGLADPSQKVLPIALIPVESGLEDVVGALPINSLELLQALAQAASNGAPISLPVTLSVPGVANAAIKLKVIEPAQVAIGRAGVTAAGVPRTQAHTGQVALQVDLNLLPTTINLVLASATLNIQLHLYLTAADATASLDNLTCATLGQSYHTATLGISTSLATLGLGVFNNLNSANPTPAPSPPLVNTSISVLGLPAIGVVVNGTAGPINVGSPVATSHTFLGPFVPQISQPSASNTFTAGTPVGTAVANALSGLISSLNLQVTLNVPVVGPLLQGILNTVVNALTSGLKPLITSTITPVLSALDTALLNPLLSLLGLSVGSADVTVSGMQVSKPDPFGAGNRPYVELIN